MNDEKRLFQPCRLECKVKNVKANKMQALALYEEICLKIEAYACPYFLKKNWLTART